METAPVSKLEQKKELEKTLSHTPEWFEYLTRRGEVEVFDRSVDACLPYGFIAGDRVMSPKGPATVVGICDGLMWFHIDGENGASFWDNGKDYNALAFDIGIRLYDPAIDDRGHSSSSTSHNQGPKMTSPSPTRKMTQPQQQNPFVKPPRYEGVVRKFDSGSGFSVFGDVPDPNDKTAPKTEISDPLGAQSPRKTGKEEQGTVVQQNPPATSDKEKEKQPETSAASAIEILPDELLLFCIERFLRPTGARFIELQRVCKKWKNMCTDDVVWRRVCEAELGFNKSHNYDIKPFEWYSNYVRSTRTWKQLLFLCEMRLLKMRTNCMSDFSEVMINSRQIWGTFQKFEQLSPFFTHFEKLVSTDCSYTYYRENFKACLNFISKLPDLMEGQITKDLLKSLSFSLILSMKLIAKHFTNTIVKAQDENLTSVETMWNQHFGHVQETSAMVEPVAQLQSTSFCLEALRQSLATASQILKGTCMKCSNTIFQMLPVDASEPIDCDRCRKARARMLTLVEVPVWLRRSWMSTYDCHFLYFHCQNCSNIFSQCKKCDGMVFDQVPDMPACTCPLTQKEPRIWLEFLEELHDPELQRAKAESRQMLTGDAVDPKQQLQYEMSRQQQQDWDMARGMQNVRLTDDDSENEGVQPLIQHNQFAGQSFGIRDMKGKEQFDDDDDHDDDD